MKTLLLLRHAKSSWKAADLADHDRPLNRRGRDAAPLVGKLIQRENLVPDVIRCSTALRTRQTCELIVREWKSPPEPVFLADLYLVPADQLVTVLRRLPDVSERALLIGHNPGLADLLRAFTGYDEKFPTAALAQLEIAIDSWRDLTSETPMNLVRLWRPRDWN